MNPPRRRTDTRGFALLALLGVIAAASMALVLAVQRFLPPLAGRGQRTTQNLDTCERAAETARRHTGAFPANLTALATASGLDAAGTWRLDPHGAAQDLDYSVNASRLRIRSRGLDRRLNTADDIIAVIPAERPVRLRQRGRLRILRALLAVSPYRQVPSMSPAERTTMRDAMRDQAIARRQWLGADAPTRALLQARMNSAATTVTGLVTLHGCTAMPVALTGASGLLNGIGSTDTAAIDGLGRALIAHATLGLAAAGNDRVGGTDDDM